MAELIARLLSHYWTADDHPAMRQAQAEDWLDDLTEFDGDVVALACQEWRQSYNRRPTPHDIREACIREASRRRERSQRSDVPGPPKLPRKSRGLNCWEPGYAERYREPWFLDLDVETQRNIKEQDLDRAEAWRQMRIAEPGDRLAAAEAEYLRVCMAQMNENLSRFGKHRRPKAAEAVDVRVLLGVSSTPSRWQNDDAVRADAKALGLGGGYDVEDR